MLISFLVISCTFSLRAVICLQATHFLFDIDETFSVTPVHNLKASEINGRNGFACVGAREKRKPGEYKCPNGTYTFTGTFPDLIDVLRKASLDVSPSPEKVTVEAGNFQMIYSAKDTRHEKEPHCVSVLEIPAKVKINTRKLMVASCGIVYFKADQLADINVNDSMLLYAKNTAILDGGNLAINKNLQIARTGQVLNVNHENSYDATLFAHKAVIRGMVQLIGFKPDLTRFVGGWKIANRQAFFQEVQDQSEWEKETVHIQRVWSR